jgi:hypothetical protein
MRIAYNGIFREFVVVILSCFSSSYGSLSNSPSGPTPHGLNRRIATLPPLNNAVPFGLAGTSVKSRFAPSVITVDLGARASVVDEQAQSGRGLSTNNMRDEDCQSSLFYWSSEEWNRAYYGEQDPSQSHRSCSKAMIFEIEISLTCLLALQTRSHPMESPAKFVTVT